MPIKIMGLFILLLILVSGCASSNKINAVDIGMSEAEVIAAMGEPDSTSAVENNVFLRLKDGKVSAYGRVGDFGLGY